MVSNILHHYQTYYRYMLVIQLLLRNGEENILLRYHQIESLIVYIPFTKIHGHVDHKYIIK